MGVLTSGGVTAVPVLVHKRRCVETWHQEQLKWQTNCSRRDRKADDLRGLFSALVPPLLGKCPLSLSRIVTSPRATRPLSHPPPPCDPCNTGIDGDHL